MSSDTGEEDEDVPQGGWESWEDESGEVGDGEVVITVQRAFYLKPPFCR